MATARVNLLNRWSKSKSTPESGRNNIAADVAGELIEIVMLPVVPAEGLRTAGEKLHTEPDGRPEQLSFSCWLNPF